MTRRADVQAILEPSHRMRVRVPAIPEPALRDATELAWMETGRCGTGCHTRDDTEMVSGVSIRRPPPTSPATLGRLRRARVAGMQNLRKTEGLSKSSLRAAALRAYSDSKHGHDGCTPHRSRHLSFPSHYLDVLPNCI